jgi:hypothetical protein
LFFLKFVLGFGNFIFRCAILFLQSNSQQSHPEINREEQREEEHNNRANSRDHYEDNFYGEDRRESKPPVVYKDKINFKRDQGGDAGYLDKKIAELERKCASMAQEMERKDKGKATVVDKLLMGTSTLFTRWVADNRLHEKFKVLQIQSYARIGDPVEHLENFRVHLDLHGAPDEVACRAFPLTLTGNAQYGSKGYHQDLSTNLKGWVEIFSWGSLWRQECVRSLRDFEILLTLQQGSKETLMDFMARFNFEKMTVEDPTNDIIFVALYQGLSSEGPLMRTLAKKQPSTL